MGKDSPKKHTATMLIMTIVVVFAALAVGIVALAKQEFIIAATMLIVILWQFYNYKRWKKHV